MCKQLTAPDINHYIGWLGRIRYRDIHDDTTYDDLSYKLIEELFKIVENIKPIRDGVYSYWISAPRGTLEDFAHYHKEDDEPISDDLIEWWHDDCPNETMLYEITAFMDNDNRHKYYGIVINNEHVIEVDYEKEHKSYPYDVSNFVSWILESTKEAIVKLKEGTYNDWVLSLMPIHLRTGTIVRKDLWDIFPEEREDFFSKITAEEINEFCSIASTFPVFTDEYLPRMKSITANEFYYYCSLGYKANNYDCGELTPKEQYYRFSDGRDGGLKDIDGDSSEAFEAWGNSEEYFGSHPWEVCRGGNSTHINLHPCKDNRGYFLWLSGSATGRCIETIKFFLALSKADLPVFLSDANILANRLLEKDIIGIVPSGIFPRYCESLFPDGNVISFMNLPYEEEKELVSKIKWQSIDKVELREI